MTEYVVEYFHQERNKAVWDAVKADDIEAFEQALRDYYSYWRLEEVYDE